MTVLGCSEHTCEDEIGRRHAEQEDGHAFLSALVIGLVADLLRRDAHHVDLQ